MTELTLIIPIELLDMKLEGRFLSKFEKSECWIWKSTLNIKGYGRMKIKDRMHFAHRLSWLLHFKEWPSGLCVLHHCDNPSCVNPKHLFLGTNLDNVKDRVSKGRSSRMFGEKNWMTTNIDRVLRNDAHPMAKLGREQVEKIRDMHKSGERQVDIAENFGITQSHVSSICRGASWTV